MSLLFCLLFLFPYSYLVEHQSVESQTKCKQQVYEEHYDAYQRLHDLPKHHNVNPHSLKSKETGGWIS